MLLTLAATGLKAQNPKHEFRGAWLHIIGQDQYATMTAQETRHYLIKQLDKLKSAGVNAIIWQIRPQADAAYPSQLEPWSRWITGKAGKAPTPLWDPLQFMIEESHKRGMELHAWINPYRVTTSRKDRPATGHIYYKHPEWFVKYADGKIYFDPALPQSRNFIDQVVRDLLARYDIDALHMDDYFYPYPVKGADFPDGGSFAQYGQGWSNRGDWRRHNVDLLIEMLHNTIQEVKPWVRLGISPFGIWRNKASDPDGSDTNGLECYDALYADCLKWTAKGWVDYMVPQLYWELEHKAASDLKLSYWWNEHANGRHMYYGQAVRKTMDKPDIAQDGGNPANPTQLDHKIRLMRKLPNVHGVTWWPAYDITSNYKGVKDSLMTHQMSTRALIAPYTWIDSIAPQAVTGVQASPDGNHINLSWTAVNTSDELQRATKFVIYKFAQCQTIDLNRADAIVDVVDCPRYTYIKENSADDEGITFVITALDRCNNESKGVAVKPYSMGGMSSAMSCLSSSTEMCGCNANLLACSSIALSKRLRT